VLLENLYETPPVLVGRDGLQTALTNGSGLRLREGITYRLSFPKSQSREARKLLRQLNSLLTKLKTMLYYEYGTTKYSYK